MFWRWIIAVFAVLCACVMLLSLVEITGNAALTQENQSNWQAVGQIGGPTQAVAVQGNYAYAGVGLRLVVLDVSNPITPTEVGSTTPFPYFVEDIVVSGTLAYVAAGGAGLRVVDVSNPANPIELGAWDSPGYAEGVATADNTVYLADGPYGLRVVDVSDPAHPTLVGAAYDMNYAFDTALSGHYAYIAAAGAGLLVADVSDPTHPVEVGALDTPGYAYGVVVSGLMAYIADAWEGLQVIDVSDSANPLEVSSYRTPGWAFGVAASGGKAYVADTFMGLRVLDVSDPAHPAELGGYALQGGHAGSVALAGTIAYVADRNFGLRILSVANPTNPTEIGSYYPMGYANSVAVGGNYAYVAAGINGLRIIDISSPARPREVGRCDIQSGNDHYSAAVTASGDYAYVGTYSQLHIVNVDDPTHPVVVGRVRTTVVGEIKEMDVEGGIVYTIKGGGLELFDVTEPAQPYLLGSIVLGYSSGVVVSDGLAYVADEQDGLHVVDVSDPHAPFLVGGFKIGGGIDVALAGHFVYLLSEGGLSIIDVSDAHQPVELSFLERSGNIRAVAALSGMAFVVDADQGLSVFDVSNPYDPQLAVVINTPGLAEELDVRENQVFLADDTGGLAVLTGVSNASLAKPAEMQLPSSQEREMIFSMRGDITSCTPTVLSGLNMAKTEHGTHTLAISYATISAGQPIEDASSVANSCIVNSTADSGPGSLRECLENASSGGTITFDPMVFSPTNPVSINLTAPLPALIQGNLTIDASNAGVILNGSGTPSGTTGLTISSDNNIVRGLQIVNFPGTGIGIGDGSNNIIGGDRSHGLGPLGEGNLVSGNGEGIFIGGTSAMSNTVLGSFIGTDINGMAIVSNGNGVNIGQGANHNVVGSLTPMEHNVIAGNKNSEVMIWGDGTEYNVVQGNLIGTDPSGSFALRNAPPAQGWVSGVSILFGARNNIIGPNNVINGVSWGVSICCSSDNTITGNFIGTNMSGTVGIGNFFNGVSLDNGAQRNRVGPINRIAYNGSAGVIVDGATTLTNTITMNAIYNNAEGIVNSNGGNASLAAPAILNATIITVTGTALPGAIVEIFSDRRNEGEVYEGRVLADASGHFTFTKPGGLTGPHVTATATDLGGNTSRFSLPALAFTVTETITVTSPLDSGPGTLRQAFLDVWPGNTIVFDPAVFPPTSPVTIVLSNPLPAITQGYITIDASDAGVILDGSYLPGGACGLDIRSDGNIVQGLQILHFPWNGILIVESRDNRIGGDRSQGSGPVGQGNVISGNGEGILIGGFGATDNIVVGNLIGTNASGSQALGNGGFGVIVNDGASKNRIGGNAPWERNIVSGNYDRGITMMGCGGNLIVGNYVGTDVSGTRSLGNGIDGITMELGAFNNLVQGNLVSGFRRFGVLMSDWGSDYNVIVGNLIGTDVTGSEPIRNGAGVGVSSWFNRIGGSQPGERNVISGNTTGIWLGGAPTTESLVLGNLIGTDITGARAIGYDRWHFGVVLHGGARALVGGATASERNVISGRGGPGPALVLGSDYNYVSGNYIGTDVNGTRPVENGGANGVLVQAEYNVFQSNLVAFSTDYGIQVNTYHYNTIRRNAIHDNLGEGIALANGGNHLLPAPVITTVTPTGVFGAACPGCTVEVFSDGEDEGRVYEGNAIANTAGFFIFIKGERLMGPCITATATDGLGNTSEFSTPREVLRWLYLPFIVKR